MRTLSIVVALVALVAVGAVGGFDYASNGKIGILPSSWMNCCSSCCNEDSDYCPACSLLSADTSSETAADCPACAATATAEKAKCCEESQAQDTAAQAKDQ